MYQPKDNEIFHVHTKRCKHASDEEDYLYVESAIRLNADRIVFTDHVPFPGDPFGFRMDMEELPGYISSMKALKKEYAGQIEILAGLEIEYLPSYRKYYQELYDSKEFDLLMLGQHFFENPDGSWSFHDIDKSEEFRGLCAAIVQGIETGLFDVVAHPDRSFRRCTSWGEEQKQASDAIIQAALEHQVFLEKNFSSKQRSNQYWPPFWTRPGRKSVLEGYDVHSVAEMEDIRKRTSVVLTKDEIESLFKEANQG